MIGLLLAPGWWEAVKAFFKTLADFAIGLGGPGLFLVALADSSFLSIPEGNDLLIVVKSTGTSWGLMSYFVLMTIAGSVAGCSILYMVGRKGTRLTLRFDPKKIEEIGRLYSRRGWLTIVIPSILPPPTPFKIFVLSAGIFRVPFPRFLIAVAIGRSIRYFTWGIVALLYGEMAKEFMANNLPMVGMVSLGIFLLLVVGVVLRRRQKHKLRSPAGTPARGKSSASILLIAGLLMASGKCSVKKTTVTAIPEAHRTAREASLGELVNLLNGRYAELDNLTFASLEVEFTGAAVEGGYIEEDKYRRANGLMIAARPDSIYLNIKNPLTGSSVATMASQGEAFQIWIPRENKYFTGNTNVELEEEQKNALLSVRPNHLLNGLLIEPLDLDDAGQFVSMKEDEDSHFKYYVVSVWTRPDLRSRRIQLVRELWFERSRMRLVRQTYYRGLGIQSKIRYSDPADVSGKLVSSRIDIERPLENYTLRFELKPEGVRINRTLREGTFDIPRPPTAELVVVHGKSQN